MITGEGGPACAIVKVRALVETGPPGGLFRTVTEAVPAAVMSLAGICAVSCGTRYEVSGARRSVPEHHRIAHEIASVHRERKGLSARRSAARREGGRRRRDEGGGGLDGKGQSAAWSRRDPPGGCLRTM